MNFTDNMATGIVTIALGVLSVATLAVILSKNSNTAGVLGAGGSALATDINAAVSPITGGGFGGLSSLGLASPTSSVIA